MKVITLLIALFVITSCAVKSPKSAEKQKNKCNYEKNVKSCLKYATWLRTYGGPNNDRELYYKKSCELGSQDGCIMHKALLAQVQTVDLVSLCTNGSYQDCYSSAKILESRKEIKDAAKVLNIACLKQANSDACKDIARLQEAEAEVAENVRKEKEAEILRKKFAAVVDKCTKGDNKVCLQLSSASYQSGDLIEAIRFAHFACANSSVAGCNLQSNYIQEKNGKDLTNQQEIANEQSRRFEQARVLKQNQDEANRNMLEASQQIGRALSGAGTAPMQPAYQAPKATKCRTKNSYGGALETTCSDTGY